MLRGKPSLVPRSRTRSDRIPGVAFALALSIVLLAAGRAASDPPAVTVDLAGVSTDSAVLMRVHGHTGSGSRGVPVTGGFDCDDDGLPDLALAAMSADPLGRDGAGEVYLIFGDGTAGGVLDTAVTQARILRIVGEGPAEATGASVWMDDVTGDGVGDLLIGRPNHKPHVLRPGAGALTVVVGSPALRTLAQSLQPLDLRSPPASVTVFTLVGAAAVDRLGLWVRTGDVTGDGVADIAVGADQEDGGGENDRGAVYVIRGGAHLATTQTVELDDFGNSALAGDLLRLVPPAGSAEYHLGATCLIADLDGNGLGEVLAGAALNRAGAVIQADGAPAGSAHGGGGSTDGTVYIAWDDNFVGDPWPAGLSIDLGSPPGTRTIIDGGDRNRTFGEEMLGGLDYDDDGAPDLFVGDLVGDYTEDQSRPASGSGHVLYDAGSLRAWAAFDLDDPPPGLVTTTFLGGAASDIAADTGAHGDFDGDGRDDLAFSSPHGSPLGRHGAGTVHVFFGQDGPWPALVDLAPGALPPPGDVRIAEIYGARGQVGQDHGDTLAYSAAYGDLDGDGRTDLVTNEMLGNGVAPGTEDVGNLLLVSGALIAGLPACGDGLDNDADTLVDDDDPGCFDGTGTDEAPECDDGVDNDGDGGIDWDGAPPDSNCMNKPWRKREQPTGCGLGFELVAALLALRARVDSRRSRKKARSDLPSSGRFAK